MNNVTSILSAAERGDSRAAAELLPLVYDDPLLWTIVFQKRSLTLTPFARTSFICRRNSVSYQERLVPTFVPALVTVLFRLEKEKGSALTRDEVVAARDRSVAIMLPESEAVEMAKARGYTDLDPEKAWEQWQTIRGK